MTNQEKQNRREEKGKVLGDDPAKGKKNSEMGECAVGGVSPKKHLTTDFKWG